MLLNVIFVLVGLGLLIAGAESLVRGAVSISTKLGISALVIGLTVVSFGTSAPELTVNIASVINKAPDLAIGNVIGSNIANILLILGICAIVKPLSVKSSTVWKEIPLALLGVSLLLVMGNDVLIDGKGSNAISRIDGIVLMSLMAIFMFYIVGMARAEKDKSKDSDEDAPKTYTFLASIGLVVLGLVGLVAGGQLLVTAAVDFAKDAGLSEALIGLTIVGVGTSLPELATSVVATRRGQTDIAIGNVVGSNIFNVFWILGLSGTILQLPFNSAASTDILVAVGATILLFMTMFLGKKHKLTRTEGIVFVTLYVCYIGFLVYRG